MNDLTQVKLIEINTDRLNDKQEKKCKQTDDENANKHNRRTLIFIDTQDRQKNKE